MPKTISDNASTTSSSTKFVTAFPSRRLGEDKLGGQQRVQAFVWEFAGEATVEDQGSGEGEDQPEQAARDGAGFFGRWIEGKAEEQQNHDSERARGVERLFRSQLHRQIFARYLQRLLNRSHRQWVLR